MKNTSFFAIIGLVLIIFSFYPISAATVFYANGAFTKNGIEWCEENKPLYELLGNKFFEHHKHSIESRVCANLIEDPLWSYNAPDRYEKLIERSSYYSELEIAESKEEAKIGVVDPNPAKVPLNTTGNIIEKNIKEEISQSETESIEKEVESIKEGESPTIGETGGGCLIATATFGSELSSRVQMLREVRDTKIMNSEVGSMFLDGFNQFYYLFSPTISDMERQSPVFKEFVKITITPLLTTLSLLNHVELNTDEEIIGWGIGIISLNVGFYVGIPFFIGTQIKRNLIK